MQQEATLHAASLRVDHRLHFEGIMADLREQAHLRPSPHPEGASAPPCGCLCPLPLHLREQDREADRDLWEQRTERFQVGRAAISLPPTPLSSHYLP